LVRSVDTRSWVAPAAGPQRGGVAIDDRNELEIGVAQRDDPVRCTPPRVTSTLDRGEAVPSLHRRPRGGEVVDRDQDVIDRERHHVTPYLVSLSVMPSPD
jgi:hypothetical protein